MLSTLLIISNAIFQTKNLKSLGLFLKYANILALSKYKKIIESS
jgi:hypothetical protein